MLAPLIGALAIAQQGAPERPYIWTPRPPSTPQLTGPTVFGVRPVHPVVHAVTATGKRPMKFTASGLPPGVTLDPATGRLSGAVGFPGTFRTRVKATNSVGSDEGDLVFVVGEGISLTPPVVVRVRSATSFVAIKGRLRDAGWTTVLVDPEKPELLEEARANGFRLAGEADRFDVSAWRAAEWDVVFMKGPLPSNLAEATTLLRQAGRDMVVMPVEPMSYEQAIRARGFGVSRSTGQMAAGWAGVSVGFALDPWSPIAGPGSWNDAGALGVGAPDLKPSEQVSQMTLWSLLSAPLVVAVDPATMNDFAFSLLTNREVLQVNQDPSGKQARLTYSSGDCEVWSKVLSDQTLAIGVFNKGDQATKCTLDFGDPSVRAVKVSDLWKQETVRMKANILPLEIRAHGAVLFRTNKNVEFRFRLGHDPKPEKKKDGGGN